MIRKLLVSLALVVGVALITPAPADAFVLQPYATARVTQVTCDVDVTYGNYGSAPYVIQTERPGSVCQNGTSIQLYFYTNQVLATQACANWMRLFNPYPQTCAFNGFSTMAHFNEGTAIGGIAHLCYEPTPGNVLCRDVGFGPWG